MPYTPILATLGYVFSPDQSSVLLIHRNRRSNDPHLGKYNGLGGKLEPLEDPVQGIMREIHEESSLRVTHLEMRGTINWPGFGAHGENWFGFLFRIHGFEGIPLTENSEGTLAWHPLESVAALPMWEGDRIFLPLVLSTDGLPFHGVMPYHHGRPVSWSCTFMPPFGQPIRSIEDGCPTHRTPI